MEAGVGSSLHSAQCGPYSWGLLGTKNSIAVSSAAFRLRPSKFKSGLVICQHVIWGKLVNSPGASILPSVKWEPY